MSTAGTVRYHISKKGNPAICRAKNNNCPLGSANEHFDSKEQVREFIEKKNSKDTIKTHNNEARKNDAKIASKVNDELESNFFEDPWTRKSRFNFGWAKNLEDSELLTAKKVFNRNFNLNEKKLNKLKEKRSDFERKYEEKTGFKTPGNEHYELSKELERKENVPGHKLVNKIQARSEYLGLPKRFSAYVFEAMPTKLNLSKERSIWLSNHKEIKVERGVNTELTKDMLVPNTRDPRHSEIIRKATEDILKTREGQQLLDEANVVFAKEKKLKGLNKDKERMKDVEEYRKLQSEIHPLVSNSVKLEKKINAVSSEIDWRKAARKNGFTKKTPGDYVTGKSIDASKIATDKNGKVNNVWAYVSAEDGGVKPIVNVKKNEYARGNSSVFVDADGNEYFDKIHYHSYRKDTQRTILFIDETVKSKGEFKDHYFETQEDSTG